MIDASVCCGCQPSLVFANALSATNSGGSPSRRGPNCTGRGFFETSSIASTISLTLVRDAHHRKFAQPRTLGRKVSDEFTVPLCREHHRDLHRHGNEVAWWTNFQIAPLEAANELWQATLLASDGAITRKDPHDQADKSTHFS